MAIGSAVRRLFGPFEPRIAESYRSIFIDIDDYIAAVRRWVPVADRILEVGCGEGAVTERLVAAYPDAQITAIDISPRVGRLYRGPRGRVRFLQCTVQELAASEPGTYDLAMLVDVLHHVPPGERDGLLDGVRRALAPGGAFILKDWARAATPIHWMSYASDRWLTGDDVRYMDRAEARARVRGCFGSEALVDERSVRPWSNNFAMLVRP